MCMVCKAFFISALGSPGGNLPLRAVDATGNDIATH